MRSIPATLAVLPNWHWPWSLRMLLSGSANDNTAGLKQPFSELSSCVEKKREEGIPGEEICFPVSDQPQEEMLLGFHSSPYSVAPLLSLLSAEESRISFAPINGSPCASDKTGWQMWQDKVHLTSLLFLLGYWRDKEGGSLHYNLLILSLCLQLISTIWSESSFLKHICSLLLTHWLRTHRLGIIWMGMNGWLLRYDRALDEITFWSPLSLIPESQESTTMLQWKQVCLPSWSVRLPLWKKDCPTPQKDAKDKSSATNNR